MSKKKEKLLNKYLNKKRKQRKRDEILAQIYEIEEKRKNKKEVSKSKNSSQPSLEEENELDDEEIKNEISDRCISLIEENDVKVEEDVDIIEPELSNTLAAEIDSISYEVKEMDCNTSATNYENFVEEIQNIEIYANVGNEVEETHNSKIGESVDENIVDLDDFLGETKNWEIVECLHRPSIIEEFRKTLPIYHEKNEIIDQIRKHNVILIKGETGSGKTTQIPQFLYEGGFKRLIGVTQPRRISAISICNRINEEMGENKCGYKIRYESTVSKDSSIKVMTDGILLKELQNDFLLSKYSVIILDEIHERSSNMDILLSLLSRIIKLRKNRNDELKLILMSATSMSEELKTFFDEITCIEIPSNSHKVSIFYEDRDSLDTVKLAFMRICKIIKSSKSLIFDSILCFLPDKKYIYTLLNMLSQRFDDCIFLPLHSQLSKHEQSLIYKNYDKRKIILSTNLAETSITIPDIYYVIDSGLVKHKIISTNNTIEYRVDYISKSSALQRAGRAGRTKPGICYRLYTGKTYERFDDLETPKIMYESLDEIILDLISLGITDVYKFPFVNRPHNESIKKAVDDLRRLGVIDKDLNLTKLGSYISKLPLPPRISKMLCIPDTQHILPELIDLACIMSVDFELDYTPCTKSYYVGEKSDLIVLLKIFRDFEKCKNRKEFCKKLCINFTLFNEILKIQKLLYTQFKLQNIEKKVLLEDIRDQIRKIIYKVNFDKIAIFYDSSYWYKKSQVFLSDSSVDSTGEYIIFDYLVKGSKKLYMKNITIIEKDWIS